MITFSNLYVEESMANTNNVIAISQDTLNSFSYIINKKIADFLKLPDIQTIQSVDWKNLSSVLSLISSTLVATLITVFFLWILYAYGLYKMAQKRGDKLAFLAFIPYVSLYTLGKIVGPIKILFIEIQKPEYVLPLLLISMYLPLASTISFILFILVYGSYISRIYKSTCCNLYYFLTIISIILPFLQPIILFAIRNKISNCYDEKNTKK